MSSSSHIPLLSTLYSCMGTVESRPEPLIATWGKHWISHRGTGECNFYLSDRKSGSTPSRPHLRADSQGGRISIWRLSFLEPFYEPRTWVSSLFHCSFVNAIVSLVLYLFAIQQLYNLYMVLSNLFIIPLRIAFVNVTTASSSNTFSSFWM